MQKKHFLLPILVLLILVCTMTAVSAAEEDFPVLVPESQSQSFEAYCAALPVVEMEAANPYTEAVPVNLMAGVDVEEPISEEEVAPITEDHVYGVVLFAIPEDSELSDVADALLALGVYNAEPVLVINGEPMVLDGLVWYRAECTENLETVIPAMLEIDGISSAEPEYLYETEAKGLPSQQERNLNWAFDTLLLNNSSKMWWSDIHGETKAPGEGVVVAVIDTGVDYTHEDLAANMWINTAEKNGVAGQDDDGNGYVDDIYGANMTANGIKAREGDPMDDNGHGTHVAGIIGMSSNNIGSVGLAYGAKIMAVKAGQSTGTFATGDIVEAIVYAHMMGADVINMSFGGTGRSNLVEAALQQAFSDCVLVAAAGNNGKPTTDAVGGGFMYSQTEDIFPAGYDYVIGVMATDQSGKLASFSNFDFFNNGGTAEYEVTAPGVNIYSTLPGDRYASWNGTSMAAPMVSAAAAILRSHYPEGDLYSSRYIMGQIASATEDRVFYVDKMMHPHIYSALNIYDSCTIIPKPNLSVKEVFLLDNVSDAYPMNDGDNTADAGETVFLGFTVRNQWGMTSDITVTADAEVNGIPHPDVTFLIDEVTLDPAGTFGEVNNGYVFEDSLLTDVTLPIVFTLDPDTPNDSEITVNLTVTAKNGADPDDDTVYTVGEKFTFRVVRGTTISGQLREDTTLSADYYWIIEDTLFVPEGITLTVEPGTQIQFYASDGDGAYAENALAGIINSGTLNMIGTEDNPISCFPGAGFEAYVVDISGEGTETLKYCEIINPLLGLPDGSVLNSNTVELVDHCRLIQNTPVTSPRRYDRKMRIETLSNSVISGIADRYMSYWQVDHNIGNLIEDSSIAPHYGTPEDYTVKNNVILPGLQDEANGELSLAPEIPVIKDNLKYADKIYSFGESKYVFLDALKNEANRDLALAYAKELGGTLLCVNSYEEEKFLREAIRDFLTTYGMSSMRVGLGYVYDEEESYIWLDGTDYQMLADIKLETPYADRPYANLFHNYENGSFNLRNCTAEDTDDNYYVLELPADMEEYDIMEGLTSFDVDEWAFDYFAPRVANNAILNPVLDLGMKGWTLFDAPDYRKAVSGINLSGNYWGTENEDLIDLMVIDADDHAGRLMDIITDPILTLDDDLSDIYPFVTSIRVEDEEGRLMKSVTPGIPYTVRVLFNRDMDPAVQPSVTYGPAKPFTDFRVTGDWEDDREWVGTMTVSPMMTGGTMYFRTSGGAAADDSWLVCGTDVLRFSFDIVNTGAQAMLLQAEGKAGRVELSWLQNDYDLFAGYNVYRSQDPDRNFVKLNDILVTGNGYVDFDVEPGVTYYYYFKVVNTEGVEEDSKSNVASAAPLDSIPPTVDHTAVSAAQANNDVTISAKVTDNIGVTKVTLYYRVYGAEEFKIKNMVEGNTADLYVARIPASAVTGAGVEYYIVAEDGENEAYSGTAQHPHIIAVDDNPYISGILPAKVDLAGGVTVSILGGNFREGLILKVGETAVEYSLIGSDQINFVAPANELGSYALSLTTEEGLTVYSPTPISYTDADGIAQIPTDMDMVSGIEYAIPLYLSVDSEMIAFHAELDIPSDRFSKVEVVMADASSNIKPEYTWKNGKLVIGCISTADFNPGADEPLLLIKVTPTAVTSDQTVDITLHDVSVNGAEVESVISGKAIIRPNFSLTAKVTYYTEGKAVPNVTVTAAGVSGVTDAAGTVTLTGISKANVTVIASKVLTAASSITAYDASLVLQSCVDKITLTDHQKIAADVDGNGSVNEYDAALILQRSVKQISAFPSSKTWIFEPASITKILYDGMNQVTFTAIYLGDVDGSWAGDE